MTSPEREKHRRAGRAGQKESLAAVRRELPAWIGILEKVHQGLVRAAASIAPSFSEIDPDIDLDHLDEPTELRSVISNVAEQHLRTAIADLRRLLKEGES